MANSKNNVTKPFLKWAGGKTQLLPEIQKRIPFKKNDTFSYIEPFAGSGAVLFWMLNNYQNLKKVVISDINLDLINSYQVIVSQVEDLISILEKWEKEYHQLGEDESTKKKYYYKKREEFNTENNNQVSRAALAIFLNKTCFNGLYRVNRKNHFNVPIGSYKKPLICDNLNLRRVSKVLKGIVIRNVDFENIFDFTGKNSFFYFDPPYRPINLTSSFNSYSHIEFNDNEQVRLKEYCDKLHKQGHKWLLSNSDPKVGNVNDNFFDDLYADYTIERVEATRNINSKADKRGKLTELLIRNY